MAYARGTEKLACKLISFSSSVAPIIGRQGAGKEGERSRRCCWFKGCFPLVEQEALASTLRSPSAGAPSIGGQGAGKEGIYDVEATVARKTVLTWNSRM